MLTELLPIPSSLFVHFLLQSNAEGSLPLNTQWSAVLLVCSVFGYALVNVFEIAIIGASRIRMRHLAEQGRRSAQAWLRIREREDRFFAAIVIFQNLFVVVASTMGGLISVDLAGGLGLIVGTVIITAAIAVFGELTPKLFAAQAADRLALIAAQPVELLIVVLRPIVLLFAGVSNFLVGLLTRGPVGVTPTVTEAELRMLIDISAEEGAVGEREAELMERVFHFYDRRVNEVMIPRTEVVWLESGTAIQEFYRVYDETPHSRFPVFRESLDDVIGIVNIKDVLRGVAQGKVTQSTPIDELMRPAFFVPETKLVGGLFVDMQEQRYQMAIAVDEYGGTAGIVTLELLLEEMVGHVVDELGQPVQEFQTIDERTTRVDAGMTIHDAREELELAIPEGDYDTLAGFVLDSLGHIPKEGESVAGDGFRIAVTEVKGRKIEELVVTRLPAGAPQRDAPAEATSGD
jgi:putative hemolysin